ncbi:TPA: hypothetical protein ONA97_003017 [Pseudomonas aeruginosa]|nr:hypothetical protein [Pseudomonas aeruginosa]HCR1693577.1 hypothetical protein [Pseudomonas aeruginosa]
MSKFFQCFYVSGLLRVFCLFRREVNVVGVDDFNSKGFLSEDLELFRSHVREKYDSLFSHAENLSSQAYCRIMNDDFDFERESNIAIFAFIQRSVRSLQAAILLCHKGLVLEAQVLLRIALECLFFSGALLKSPDIFERLSAQGDNEESKYARINLEGLDGKAFDPEHIAALQDIESRGQERNELSNITVVRAAEISGMKYHYNVAYRGLSTIAAHANFRSFDSTLSVSENGGLFMCGPTEERMEFTLGLICEFVSIAMCQLDELRN